MLYLYTIGKVLIQVYKKFVIVNYNKLLSFYFDY